MSSEHREDRKDECVMRVCLLGQKFRLDSQSTKSIRKVLFNTWHVHLGSLHSGSLPFLIFWQANPWNFTLSFLIKYLTGVVNSLRKYVRMGLCLPLIIKINAKLISHGVLSVKLNHWQIPTYDELATDLDVPRLSSKIAGIGSSSCPPMSNFFSPLQCKIVHTDCL